MDNLHASGVSRAQRATKGKLRKFPRNTLSYTVATSKVVHQFLGGLVSNRLSFAGKKNLSVLPQAVAVVVLFKIGSQAVKALEPECERLKLTVATAAVGVGDALLGDPALAQAWLTGDWCCVDTGWRIFDDSCLLYTSPSPRD